MAKRATKQPVATVDSFQNFVARLGMGAGTQIDGSRYGFNPVTRNRMQMDYAYRGSWIVGIAVDAVAEDMTREGVTVHSDDKPDQIKQLHREMTHLAFWEQICQCIQWSRLYGGCIGYLMIDGQDASTPLKLETVGKDQFRGVMPIDRWVLNPVTGTGTALVSDLGPNFGKPIFYDVVQDTTGAIPAMHIHHSRVIRFGGVDLPYYQRIAENLWGQSILERLWDRLIAFDSTTAGVAQLVFKAHLRNFKVKGMREIIAAGGPAAKALVNQIAMMRAFQTNEGITLMDATDEFEVHTQTFAGLSDVLMQFGEQLSGALQIPLVRLFGQSPGGLNSTGESDLRTYYDGILRQQRKFLAVGVDLAYRLCYQSVFGKPAGDDFEVMFNPLWQLDATQKAEVAAKNTDSVVKAFESGLINRATGMRELKAMSREVGIFSNIDDKDIKEAESDPAPTPEALGLALPEKPDPVAVPGKPAVKPGMKSPPAK